MAENGEEKLIAVARHIAKTLGHTDTMTDDILQIFSNFDGRFREKLVEKFTDDDPRALEQTLKSLSRQISRYVSAEDSIWFNSVDASAFLDVIDDLLNVIHNWTPMAREPLVDACLRRADDLIQKAMFRLEDEFKTVMERDSQLDSESFDLNRYRKGDSTATAGDGDLLSDFSGDEDEDDGETIVPVAHPISDYNIVIDPLASGTINDLQEISKRMISAGYVKECSNVYSSCRREFLEESFFRLGLQKLSIEEMYKMEWSDLDDEIERWKRAANVAFRILFPSERRLCDRVFFNFSTSADLSFIDVCRGSTIQLLNFADAVAVGSRAPERLFRVLDVYETVRDLLPDMEALFSDEHCSSLKHEAMMIWNRLGEAIRGILMELENLIRRDPAKAAVPGGGLHPITRYVMNYLRAACRSRQTLEQVFFNESSPSSSLSDQIAWIMELLERNLEAKANIYKDPALSSVFMMNNGRYMVQKVKGDELGNLLGEDWIRNQNSKIKQCHGNYQRSSWSKVLGCLKLENNLSSSNSSSTSKILREKLKSFNIQFEEMCRIQSTWVIFDEQLRNELRISVSNHLTAGYRSFIGRLQAIPEMGKNMERRIKYSVEDVEGRINELFRGSCGRK
ncbi:exocyst complex component EXO70B1 [Impatiens glandulifera]|uniref:exocyst complex component EXO70B1 n=1 Tax=Impatiens glandulifera TaxID=253017 RepID=UPI001FB0956B|nr:exocyst complex component EXO70B1 [Impatiens glandulifera]